MAAKLAAEQAAHRPQDAEVIKADFERGHRNGLDIELIPKEAGQPLQPALEARRAFQRRWDGAKNIRREAEVRMKCLRIYASPDGESHFGDVDIAVTMMPLFPDEASFGLSAHHSA